MPCCIRTCCSLPHTSASLAGQSLLPLPAFQAAPPCLLQVYPPVVAFRVQSIEDTDLKPYRCFEFLDSRGQWDDFSYRKCIG